MRPLTREETVVLFEKLGTYIGANVRMLIDRADEPFCFRLHKQKVFYVAESIMKHSISISKHNLVSLGVLFGRFTASGKFRLAVTCLPELAQFASFKVWIKSGGEMSYLYGNHVLKAHVARITEDCPVHQGVVVFTMLDVPIGFGTTAKATADLRKLDPTSICVFHQTDVGEYLRNEDTMF